MIEFLEEQGVYRVSVVKKIAGKQVRKTKVLPAGSTIEDAENRETRMMNVASTLAEQLQLCAEQEAETPGCVYIAKNEFMPGLVKIGMTTGSVGRRLTNLSCSLPSDFELVHESFLRHPKAIEQALHLHFSEFRVSKNREFFRLPEDKAMAALAQAFEIDGIDLNSVLSKAFG